MTANAAGRCAPNARLYSAGTSLRCARSPLPPKITIAQGSGADSARSPGRSGLAISSCSGAYGTSSAFLHRVSAELVAQRRLHLGAERLVLARGDAHLQGERDHGRGDVLIDRRLDRPAPFAAVLDVPAQP